jgi:hypothetical protein
VPVVPKLVVVWASEWNFPPIHFVRMFCGGQAFCIDLHIQQATISCPTAWILRQNWLSGIDRQHAGIWQWILTPPHGMCPPYELDTTSLPPFSCKGHKTKFGFWMCMISSVIFHFVRYMVHKLNYRRDSETVKRLVHFYWVQKNLEVRFVELTRNKIRQFACACTEIITLCYSFQQGISHKPPCILQIRRSNGIRLQEMQHELLHVAPGRDPRSHRFIHTPRLRQTETVA